MNHLLRIKTIANKIESQVAITNTLLKELQSELIADELEGDV